jgi:hypothetical protein
VIAKRELIGLYPSGKRFSIVIEIGKPFPKGDPNDSWYCPVSITPLDHRVRNIGGYDAMQALCLAVRYATCHLAELVRQGGRLLFPDSDEDFDLDLMETSPRTDQS